jgi:uncharacterized protein YecT (DUF1311 family)
VVEPGVGAQDVRAQPAPPAPCSEQGSPYALSACLERAWQAADRDLNAAYRQAQAHIDRACEADAACRTDWRASLQRAQRAWIAYRDADCRELVGYEWRGGTGAGPATLSCLRDRTAERAQDLARRYGAR